jgi:hypothetical protein
MHSDTLLAIVSMRISELPKGPQGEIFIFIFIE